MALPSLVTAETAPPVIAKVHKPGKVKADPLRGMFENLASLEDRIVGVFTQKTVETSRTLLTD